MLIPAATVTSGTLSAGWNFIPLPSPIPLSIGGSEETGGACYVAATGVNGNFPDTNGYFTTGGAAPAGITTGPLVAFSDQSGSNPGPFATPQGVFGTAGPDPTVYMPADGYESANFWMDLQVSDTAPAGYTGSYRLWPNFVNPTNGIAISNDTGTQTMGTIFSLSQPCMLDNVWLYSPAGVEGLPASTQIWNTATESLVPGTNISAAWSGSAGGGWIANSYSALKHRPAGRLVHRYRLQRQRAKVLYGDKGLLRLLRRNNGARRLWTHQRTFVGAIECRRRQSARWQLLLLHGWRRPHVPERLGHTRRR